MIDLLLKYYNGSGENPYEKKEDKYEDSTTVGIATII